MSVSDVQEALERIEEPAWTKGTVRVTDRVAISLPDGDLAAADDATFADWLREHGEPAPFGDGNETRLDPAVRDAYRLVARDKAQVHGFDLPALLDQVAAAISPRRQLSAKLVDVVVYFPGGRFATHKDTPRTQGLIGTLIVGLPVAYDGGAFVLDDGRDSETFYWNRADTRAELPWVAFYGDVDHEVKLVTGGARVTAVYALEETDQPREDPTWETRRATLRAAIEPLERQAQWPVMIPCTRHVITTDAKKRSSIGALRGFDRDLADVLIEAGYDVAVRPCIASCEESEARRLSADYARFGRLKAPMTPDQIEELSDLVSFADDAEDDEGTDMSNFSIQSLLLPPIYQWVMRRNAAATFIHEALLSDTDYFGNEAYSGHLYTLSALEVTQRN